MPPGSANRLVLRLYLELLRACFIDACPALRCDCRRNVGNFLVCQAYTAAEATYARAGYAAWKPPAPDLLHWDSVDRSAVLMHKHLFPLDGSCG